MFLDLVGLPQCRGEKGESRAFDWVIIKIVHVGEN